MELPTWLKAAKERLEFYEIMIRAFEIECDCDVCKRIREWATKVDRDLQEMTKLLASGRKCARK